MEITADFIQRALNSKHLNYVKTVTLAEQLKVHADGRVPENLIFERRPSEPLEIQEYRKKIYVPKTKNPIYKVINSLEKIRRSSDWVIDYNKNDLPVVRNNESLSDYCEVNYPVHSSVTNWMFAEGLKQYLLDANGVVAVFPENTDVQSSEYLKPVAKFFESKHVLDFEEGKYCVLLSYDKSELRTPSGQRSTIQGDIYYIITDTQFTKYEQINRKEFKQTQIYNHNIGYLPVFKVGGLFKERLNNDTIFESRISSMIPSLNEAAREYSDLQAEIILHIHSEKYIYANNECTSCNGTGTIKTGTGQETCQSCSGTGKAFNPAVYGIHMIDAGRKVDDNPLPTPPIGYIQKSTEIAKLQDERVRQHLYDALSTLNMEFLAETPLNQSGTAKEVDKDELNNFVNSIAEDIVRIMDNIYYYICEWRYMISIGDKEKRKLLLPRINVPTKYDILSSNYLLSELKTAKESGLSPVTKKAIEIEYTKKKFNTQPEIAEQATLCFLLDPLYGITEDEKFLRKSNNGILESDYIISSNIQSFVQRAMDEVNEFSNLNYAQQMDKMNQYATEIQNKLKTTAQVIP